MLFCRGGVSVCTRGMLLKLPSSQQPHYCSHLVDAVALQETSGSLTRHIMNRQVLGAGSRSASLMQAPSPQHLTGLGVFHSARGSELLKLRRQVSLGLRFRHDCCCKQAVCVSQPGSLRPAIAPPSHA